MLLTWILGPICCAIVPEARAAVPEAGGASTAPAETQPFFSIARQTLHDALQAYSEATGRSVLYDAGQVEGLLSSRISGRMDPDRALDALLEGTGMRARFASSGAFVLVPDGPLAPENRVPFAASEAVFYGRLQAVVTSALCADAGLSIGQYRLAISMRVSEAGTLEQVRAAATGHVELEARIAGRLAGKSVDVAPPPAMAQPIVLLVLPQQGRLKACAS